MHLQLKKILFQILFLFCATTLVAQVDTLPVSDDSLGVYFEQVPVSGKPGRAEKYAHLNPNKAALLSAIVPGAGQIYNKSYWKLPLIYGGLTAFVVIANYNHNEYIRYKRAYNNATDENDATQVEIGLIRLSENALKANRNATKKYRDLNIILGALFYGLQIADAYVDAHLKGFEVTDDISMHIEPAFYMNGNNAAGGLTLNFRIR